MEGQEPWVTCKEGCSEVLHKDMGRYLALQFISSISLFHKCTKANRNITKLTITRRLRSLSSTL